MQRTLEDTAGVTLKRQWSLDGKTWKLGATVITEKTLADDYTGIHNTAVEQTPFAHLIAEIRDTVGSAEMTAEISVWGYHKYRV